MSICSKVVSFNLDAVNTATSLFFIGGNLDLQIIKLHDFEF